MNRFMINLHSLVQTQGTYSQELSGIEVTTLNFRMPESSPGGIGENAHVDAAEAHAEVRVGHL